MTNNHQHSNRRDGNEEKRVRAFVAIELPESVLTALARLQQEIRNFGFHASWTRPESIHLTLKFLGDTAVSNIDPISGRIAEAARQHVPMMLLARSVGVFPGARRARVLWTGVGGDIEQLSRLQSNLEDGLAAVGYEREGRRFAGHFTLARFKGAPDPEQVVSAIERFGDFASEPFTAAVVHLFESRLSPKGAVYTKLASHRLGVF